MDQLCEPKRSYLETFLVSFLQVWLLAPSVRHPEMLHLWQPGALSFSPSW